MGRTDDAIEKIKLMLLSGELRPGDRLPVENDLASRLGVSRNSLREAVRALTTMRVLMTRQGDGTYVTSLAPEMMLDHIRFAASLHQDATVLQFVAVRRILEPEAVALAVPLIGDGEIAKLGDLLDELVTLAGEQPVDTERLVANDQMFHSILTRASENPVLSTIVESMSAATVRARIWRGIAEDGAIMRTIGEHRAIYQAVLGRDVGRARLQSAVHIAGVEDWLKTVV